VGGIISNVFTRHHERFDAKLEQPLTLEERRDEKLSKQILPISRCLWEYAFHLPVCAIRDSDRHRDVGWLPVFFHTLIHPNVAQVDWATHDIPK
jgi:hypothetical protein